ncbi:MAG: DUF4185 domain-containing protein [Tepidisphaeraceae bacterium]
MNRSAAMTDQAIGITVKAARDRGVLFADNPHRMVGQDGAFSIGLEGGRTLWFFGDTLVGRRPPAGQSLWSLNGQPVGPRDMTGRGTFEHMINNTALLLRHKTGGDALNDFQYITDSEGKLRPLIPLEGDEHPDRDRIWCQHGVAQGERVCLSFIKVRMLDTGPLPVNFEIVGSGLAMGSTRDWQFDRVKRGGDSILWSAEQPHFATAFLDSPADGFVYLYGTVKEGDTQNCYVARVPRGEVDRPERYEYLANCDPAWSREVSDSIPVFSGMPSELSVSFNPHLRVYLAVHSLDLSGKIVGRTAPRPWGPWSDPVTLWTVKKEHPFPYMQLIYAGKEHPELSGDNGRRIYLTYIEFEEYFPHLVEVILE